MRLAKRFTCVLLALVMILSLGVTAFADEVTPSTTGSGSITIDNAVKDKVYTIYRIFDIDSYNEDYSAFNYKVSDKWGSFFKKDAAGLTYVDIDEMGYVTAKSGFDAAKFAEAALAFTKTEGATIDNDGTATASGSTVTFNNLTLGYYLVGSSLGSLCSLDTTNPTATIKEKNGAPSVVKQVQEDSNSTWGKQNDADIGQTVNFKTTINVVDGNPKNYVLHDEMSAGLNFNGTVTVKVKNGTEDEVSLTAGTDYTLVNKTDKSSSIEDNCTFEIHFIDKTESNGSRGLKPNDVITVEYSATVNASAVIAGDGNPNTTWLKYGEKDWTEKDTTRTYVWQFEVFKYTKKGDQETALKDAKFRLYKKVTGEGETETKQYATASEVKNDDGKVTGYKLTGWTTSEDGATTFTSPEDGKFNIIGLDADNYYLEETAAPAGYNKLKNPVKVEISKTFTDTSTSESATVKYNDTNATNNEVKVENKTGTELPSTGGVGTTIFYVLGSVLVIGAAVLLITKRRMNAEA